MKSLIGYTCNVPTKNGKTSYRWTVTVMDESPCQRFLKVEGRLETFGSPQWLPKDDAKDFVKPGTLVKIR